MKPTITCTAIIAGLYPFEGNFSKNGFILQTHVIDEKKVSEMLESELLFINPLLLYCAYTINKKIVYMTFFKQYQLNIELTDSIDNNKQAIKKFEMENKNFVWYDFNDLQEELTIEINNYIILPIRHYIITDSDNNKLSENFNFVPLNIPLPFSSNIDAASIKILRQNLRLSSGIDFNSIKDLTKTNKYFKNALSFYFSSNNVTDISVGFTLLINSLESLLNKSTYEKVHTCSICNQKKYEINKTISKNVSVILQDKSMLDKIRSYYSKRSKFVHEGSNNINDSDKKELEEITRKILLLYWYVSLDKTNNSHKKTMNYILSDNYRYNLNIKAFSEFLSENTYQDKVNNICSMFFNDFTKSEKS